MRTLLEERDRHFWRSWSLWATLGGLLVAMACMLAFAMRAQQADTQRRLDSARALSVIDIEQQIVKLREADAKSAMDRNHLKKEVEEIKEDIQGVPPPFMRAGKAFKKSVDQFKGQGSNP